MVYNLYKSSDNITPFVVVAENAIDNTSTSLYLVGKRKEAYGAAEQQSKLWLLESFANSTPPSNPINGQLWYNTVDEQLYVCVDELTQTFEKVNNPIVSGSAPVLNLTEGNLWFDNTNARLYIWDGSQWVLIGPQSSVPLTVKEEYWLNRITSNATTSEMWVNGVTNERLVIPNNTTWLFEITLVARRTNATGERRSWKFAGMIDNTSNTVSIDGSAATTLLSQSIGTASYVAAVSADNTNKSLKMDVTGETSKDISWNSVVILTKVS